MVENDLPASPGDFDRWICRRVLSPAGLLLGEVELRGPFSRDFQSAVAGRPANDARCVLRAMTLAPARSPLATWSAIVTRTATVTRSAIVTRTSGERRPAELRPDSRVWLRVTTPCCRAVMARI
jgi:uncharacterized membrane protein